MAIPESQLDTWSHQGSITQSSATYATVKRALEAYDTKYSGNDFEVFLQGSYGNDTNIYAKSDVDVVIRLDATFHYDLSALTPVEAAAFEVAYAGSPSYSYSAFKADVVAALEKSFVTSVKPDKKAIKIKANGNRRSADVVVATEFRRYSSFPSLAGAQFSRGICFFTSSGDRIVNYPKQHSANCTAKHQAASEWFKPMVRILKNMRSRIVEEGTIEPGCAPSYFLEGLLYNVPNDKFGTSYGDTFVATLNWILEAERNDFVCASEQYYLVRNSAATCWPVANCAAFLDAVVKLWNEWE